jgi:hypothetical protein
MLNQIQINIFFILMYLRACVFFIEGSGVWLGWERRPTFLHGLQTLGVAVTNTESNVTSVKLSSKIGQISKKFNDCSYTRHRSVLRIHEYNDQLSLSYRIPPPPPPMPPHVPYGLRGLPSRLWLKCNRLMRLGRP